MASVLAGILITILTTSQMSWKTQDVCVDYNVVTLTSVKRIDCAHMEYGFPKRFLYSEPSVYVINSDIEESSPETIGVSSITKINRLNLFIDVSVWSTLCFALLVMLPTDKKSKK